MSDNTPPWLGGSHASTGQTNSGQSSSGTYGGHTKKGGETTPIETDDTTDVTEVLGKQEQALNALSSQNRELQSTLQKMKNALNGDETRSDGEDDGGWYDDVLEAGLQHKMSGGGIPLTVNIATQLRNTQKENAELQRQIKEIQEHVKQGLNPNQLHNQRVYEKFDNLMSETIQEIYGESRDDIQETVTKHVAKEVRRLQSEDPKTWDRIRRDAGLQEKLVRHYVAKNIPPGLLKKMEQDYMRNSPMTETELVQAFQEADEIEDPRIRDKVKSRARQEYFENKLTRNKSKSFQGRLNSL